MRQSTNLDITQSHIHPAEPENNSTKCHGLFTKINFARIVLIILATICFILVIYILVASQTYFSQLFQAFAEQLARKYLNQYYSKYLATIYLAIIGAIMLLSNTIVFFAKLSEKDKIVWMHVAYFLAFLICGMLVVFNGDYTSRMSALTLLDSMGADCLAMSYPKECLISPKYLVFQSQMTLFFIGYSIIFCVYSVIYHFSVIKFQHRQQQSESENEKHAVKQEDTKNDSFVNQISQFN